MKKYIIVDDDFRCFGYSDYETDNTNEIEYDFSNSEITFEEFIDNPMLYELVDGKMSKSNAYIIEYNNELKKQELKLLEIKREMLYNKYADRSPMFYNSLTDEKRIELENWYQIWRKMPELYEQGVWEEPEIPKWLISERNI